MYTIFSFYFFLRSSEYVSREKLDPLETHDYIVLMEKRMDSEM